MTNEELKTVLELHKKWLDNDEGGIRANMRDADMRGADMSDANMSDANMSDADMRGADMRYANMRGANMRGANMRGANMSNADMRGADMRGADMRYANIDYSAWPLWCGSLKAHVNDRIAIQLLYHTLSVVQHSPYVSDEVKRTLLTAPVVEIANRFHHVRECGELAVYAAEGK